MGIEKQRQVMKGRGKGKDRGRETDRQTDQTNPCQSITVRVLVLRWSAEFAWFV